MKRCAENAGLAGAPGNSLFKASTGVCLVGGGPFGPSLLERGRGAAPALVCADGGANQIGDLLPEWIIGDGDSIAETEVWRKKLGDRLVILSDQDTTDLEKCLHHVDAPYFVGVGFLGGRLDHELAALHALIADPRRIVLLGGEDVVMSAGLGIGFDTAPGERISILPLRPVRAGTSTGLVWPIDGMTLGMGGRIGSSNAASAARVEMRFDQPGAVIVAPASRLDAFLAARVLENRSAREVIEGNA